MSTPSFATQVLTTSVLALSAVAGLSQPGSANNIEISCQIQKQLPTVVATKIQGELESKVTLLTFLPEYFSSKTARENCQQAAATLQTLSQEDRINYLTADTIEQKSVVCAVARRGLNCAHDSAQPLFNLTANIEPNQVLYNMLGNQLKPAQPSVNRTVGRIYTQIDPPRWWEFWGF
jgi:hypothetical protein